MKLVDYIEGMRSKLHDDHGTAMRLLDALGARLFENDCEIMRALETIDSDLAKRAADIFALAQQVASRLGRIPTNDQRAGVDEQKAKHMAKRFAPPPLPVNGHEAMQSVVDRSFQRPN